MLLIGSRKIWKDMPGTGASFLLSPLSAEDRDACLAESADAGPAPLAANATDKERAEHALRVTQARNKAWVQALLPRVVHGWRGLISINEIGDVEPLLYHADARSVLADTPEVVQFIEQQALGLGLKVFESLEEAGNALRTGSAGTDAAARSASST